MSVLWRVATACAHGYTRNCLPTPSVAVLRTIRRAAAASVRARYELEARALRGARADANAAEEHGALVERALAEMREEVLDRAWRQGPHAALLARAHDRFGHTDETEHVDDPRLDPERRRRVVAALDAVNQFVGCYEMFFEAIAPFLSRDRETRVLDLAAGHGGFALEASRIARRRGIRLSILATDLRPEYLALGAAVAEREGLAVRFAVQDALDLSGVRRGEHDVVLCTQSLHHWRPRMIARLFDEASAVAGRGVVLIDGCRSTSLGALVTALASVRVDLHELAHDAWVSFRRFYTPEELELVTGLGRLDPISAEWMRPGHCVVRAHVRRPS